MKRMISLVSIAVTFPALGGCAAAAIGGGAYYFAEKREQRREFISSFQKTNIERESNGLEPLDFCTEFRRFDPDMAEDEPECQN